MKPVFAMWWGGPNYAFPTRDDIEEFPSEEKAREVFEERIAGFDPVSKKRTPVVTESCMWLYNEPPGDDDEPFVIWTETETIVP